MFLDEAGLEQEYDYLLNIGYLYSNPRKKYALIFWFRKGHQRLRVSSGSERGIRSIL